MLKVVSIVQLGWIDFSKTERSKILSVLDLLQENGTLDELGIAPVRDGFSNIFFPGTSTIQTRAKYFLIVPYALKDLERSNETNPNVLRKTLDAIGPSGKTRTHTTVGNKSSSSLKRTKTSKVKTQNSPSPSTTALPTLRFRRRRTHSRKALQRLQNSKNVK